MLENIFKIIILVYEDEKMFNYCWLFLKNNTRQCSQH